MALIQCVECGAKISSYAEKCVHCGYPIGRYVTQLKNYVIENERFPENENDLMNATALYAEMGEDDKAAHLYYRYACSDSVPYLQKYKYFNLFWKKYFRKYLSLTPTQIASPCYIRDRRIISFPKDRIYEEITEFGEYQFYEDEERFWEEYFDFDPDEYTINDIYYEMGVSNDKSNRLNRYEAWAPFLLGDLYYRSGEFKKAYDCSLMLLSRGETSITDFRIIEPIIDYYHNKIKEETSSELIREYSEREIDYCVFYHAIFNNRDGVGEFRSYYKLAKAFGQKKNIYYNILLSEGFYRKGFLIEERVIIEKRWLFEDDDWEELRDSAEAKFNYNVSKLYSEFELANSFTLIQAEHFAMLASSLCPSNLEYSLHHIYTLEMLKKSNLVDERDDILNIVLPQTGDYDMALEVYYSDYLARPLYPELFEDDTDDDM